LARRRNSWTAGTTDMTTSSDGEIPTFGEGDRNPRA
jgi:hypothetical protein